MLFNSLEFLAFFVGTVTGYLVVPARIRWTLLLAASYLFYAAWRPEYLLLIWASTLVDFWIGLRMGALPERRARRPWLLVSLVANLGLLGFFKYFDFFGKSLQSVFDLVRVDVEVPALDLLLPVGISFYTFQTLSYSVDVYRGRREAERHLGFFALYVSFFPQLVAGPIERSTRLLPQLRQRQDFDPVRVRNGLALMLFGFFKKCVVADRLAIYVDEVFSDPGSRYEGLTCLVATYFFQWQIYCDFSGYSDIAIGAAAVMGYELMTNFRRPFLATSILDFWNRWHISLTTWFRDYMYFPLLGRKASVLRRILCVMLVFAVSGLWHGPTWNCVAWGSVNGLFLVVGVATLRLQNRIAEQLGVTRVPGLRRAMDVLLTFHLGTFGLMFFRTSTMREFGNHLRSLLLPEGTFWKLEAVLPPYELGIAFGSVGLLLLIQLFQERHGSTLIGELGERSRWIRWPIYYAFLFSILMFGEFDRTPFFYFQF